MIRRLRRWKRRLRTLRRLDASTRLLTCETIMTLTVARLLVRIVPVHAIRRRMTGVVGRRDRSDEAAVLATLLPHVARAMPFRAMCLEQSLAMTMMLRRRGIASTLHLGVTRDAPGVLGFEAHAWISVAGIVVIGGPIDRYTELTRY